MINFVGRGLKDKARLSGVKRVVVVGTTVVLGIYVVAWSGWLGWNYYLSFRLRQSTSLEGELTGKIGKLADREVLVRQVFARSGVVDGAIERKKLETLIPILEAEGVAISGWTYRDGEQSVTVAAVDPGVLEDYIENLKKTYPKLSAGVISWVAGGQWTIEITLEGKGDPQK